MRGYQQQHQQHEQHEQHEQQQFWIDTSTSSGFNLASLVIILMLAGLYIAWW